jgi:hypothetical protein
MTRVPGSTSTMIAGIEVIPRLIADQVAGMPFQQEIV